VNNRVSATEQTPIALGTREDKEMHVMTTPRGDKVMTASLPARWCTLGVLVLAAVACSGTSSKASEPSTRSTTPPETATTPTTIVTRGDLLGVWSGDWGTMVLRSGGDGLVVGAYDHDEGTVTGHMVNGVFEGWWCEAPSREPANDAGLVEFRFANGSELSLDGRWQYGAKDRWRENWDLTKDASPPPAALEARFDDPTAFCSVPTNSQREDGDVNR
jgi:hypothetical protein